jgi:hypothetical protein
LFNVLFVFITDLFNWELIPLFDNGPKVWLVDDGISLWCSFLPILEDWLELSCHKSLNEYTLYLPVSIGQLRR